MGTGFISPSNGFVDGMLDFRGVGDIRLYEFEVGGMCDDRGR
jgi:hypothetical protein